MVLTGLLEFVAHIDELDFGQRAVHHAFANFDAGVLASAEFCQLSSDGVAEPSTTTASASLARITATSRAL